MPPVLYILSYICISICVDDMSGYAYIYIYICRPLIVIRGFTVKTRRFG